MKRTAAMIALVAGAMVVAGMSTTRPTHRVVFDASTGEETWEGILNNVENLQRAFDGEKISIEVVAHGKALGLVLDGGSHSARVRKLAGAGIVFAACANTMARRKAQPEDLVPGTVVVPSGVAEVVRKQEAGWSYVKAGG